ncbi:MAG: metallophosphoesterase family protein [Acidimicrobiales bacterium]
MAAGARALVVSDTHLGDGQADRLITRLGALLDGLDAILHAGDVVHAGVLSALREHAPVHAVLGNNDHGLRLPEQVQVELGGRTVAMVHDSGASTGRGPRLRRWFPAADVVVFGHSHAPWHETHVDDRGHVQHHLNPGSAMQRRAQPVCTVALLTLSADAIDVSFVPVG